MNIGIATYDYDPPIGGIGNVTKHLKTELKRLFPAFKIIVLSPSPRADDRVSPLAAGRWNRRAGCPLFSFSLALRLSYLIKKHKLHLLHVHAGSGGVFLLQKPSIPLIVTAHHAYLQEAESVFRHHPFTAFRKRVMSWFERRTYKLADKVVCVSLDTAAFLIDRYKIDAAKVSVIENGVQIPGKIPNIEKDDQTILFIGRLEERKGIWILLDAFHRLRSSHPKARLRLVGKNLLGGRIDQYIVGKGLKNRVTVTGYVYDPLMRRELQHATVLVVPSLLEGFGLIAAEAMLLGTCVVVSDSAGLKSIVKDGETGLVFPSGSAEKCAKAIAKILDDKALRQKLEKHALAEATKRFCYEERVKDLVEIYEMMKK